ncbi:expressed unknown protein [Seminavis robusta]|uniref:Uncharacterized protein n=1 Tax=Seminavis robusta TaxID=568900 RepID=A0A9N8EIR1_9STRA|nr:expressed unknown protein [Seminavis robusta]|eukprot:Sro1200_g251850.1 n/a (330) ;mRNA; f:12689-13805
MDPNANDHGGMDTDSDLKILSMDSATLKSVVKSELLASGLTCHVMAEQVLGFLAKECVLKCLEVEDLCQRFDLKSYYCSIHGTKLESQVERRRGLENMAGTDDDQGENADQIGNNDNVAAEVNIECEDCVEAEFDRERCNYCEQFENMDELHQCNKCSYQECGPCFEGNSMDYCNSCEEMYCGREGCETFENCDCGEGFCSVCQEENFRACLRCGTNGCIDCFYDFGFRCNQCDKTFCHDCQDNGYCERCEHTFCSACKEIWYCGCDHGSCYDCDEPVKCEIIARSVTMAGFALPVENIIVLPMGNTLTAKNVEKALMGRSSSALNVRR